MSDGLKAHVGTDRCWRCQDGLHGLDKKRGSCSCLCHLPKGPTNDGLAGRELLPERTKRVRGKRGAGLTPSTRSLVYQRDKMRCRFCGVKLPLDRPKRAHPTLDHLLPRSRGGTNTMENLVTSCADCNNRKGDKTPEEAGMPVLPVSTKENVD